MDEAVDKKSPLSQAETWEKPLFRLIFTHICSVGKGMTILSVRATLPAALESFVAGCGGLGFMQEPSRKMKIAASYCFGGMSNQYSFG